jgi:inhibitor of cysteine peptidase
VAGWNFLLLARVAALVGASLLHVASAGSACAQKADPMPSLTEADNDQTVDLRVGETFHVRLPENATTGYRWTIDRLDDEVVEAVGSEPDYAAGSIGSGGAVTFTFRAKKPGSGDIALKHWRHFEGDASVTNRFRLRLNARPR